MKKKFVSYLILAGAVFGLAMVGSCKDYEYEVLQDQIDNLNGTTSADIKTLSGKLTALQGDVKKLQGDVAGLNNAALSDSLAKAYKMLQNLTGKTSISDMTTEMSNLNKLIAAAASQTYVDGKVTDLTKAINAVKFMWSDSLLTAFTNAEYAKNLAYAWSDSLKKAYDNAKDALSAIEAMEYEWSDSLKLAYDKAYESYDSAMKALNLAKDDSVRIDGVRADLDTLIAHMDTLVGRIELTDSLKNLEKRYQDADDLLQDSIDALATKIEKIKDELEDKIAKANKRIDSLFNAEKKRITSLYVQGAMNPMFGSFALPAGIRTNVLGAYYGEVINATEFPLTKKSSDNSAIVDDAMLIQNGEIPAIGTINKINIPAGTILSDDEANAGYIYLTVNPNEVELDDTYKFSFVTSDGATTPATIGALAASTEKLTYGWTRAASANGFYKAPVKITDPDAVKYSLPFDELVGIAKDVVNGKVGLTGVAQAVYQLTQGHLDANAVKVEWSDSLGKHNVTSHYDVAVTAVKPISFNAMTQLSGMKKLPTISPLSELSIDVPTISLNLSDINLEVGGQVLQVKLKDLQITTDGKLLVTISVPTVSADGKSVTYSDNVYTVDKAGKAKIVKDFVAKYGVPSNKAEVDEQIENAFVEINKIVKNVVSTKFQAVLDKEVNSVIEQVENSVNKQLKSFNSYASQLNSLVSKVNGLTSRLNMLLDGGALLAPWIMYEGTDGSFHPMSNDPENPSVFKKGKGGIVLYLTSFNADLLAPAYKKYVAVSDCYNITSTGSKSSKIAQAKKVNNSNKDYYNKVLDGERYAVPFNPTDAGTYVIYYSAVDYSGYVAAERFYVTVEE